MPADSQSTDANGHSIHSSDTPQRREESVVDDGDIASTPEPARSRSRVANSNSKSTEAFTKAERDEMERLLGELCGHLGEFEFLRDECKISSFFQLFILLDSWRAKMSPTTFYSTLTGKL